MKRIGSLILHSDIYLAVAAAIAVTVYSVVVKDNAGLATVTLSTLLVALVALIGLRSRLDEVLARTAKVEGVVFSETLPPDFEDKLLRASEVWISGIHRHDFFSAHQESITELSQRQDAKWRVLFVPPDGKASAMAAMRFVPQDTPEGNEEIHRTENLKIRGSLALFAKLKAGRASFAIRTLDFLQPYGVVILDPNTDSSIMYIEHFTFRTQGGNRKPKAVHRPGSHWYTLAKAEFEHMWRSATEYEVSHA